MVNARGKNIIYIYYIIISIIFFLIDPNCANCQEGVNCNNLHGCSLCVRYIPPECHKGDIYNYVVI